MSRLRRARLPKLRLPFDADDRKVLGVGAARVLLQLAAFAAYVICGAAILGAAVQTFRYVSGF